MKASAAASVRRRMMLKPSYPIIDAKLWALRY
jgi:hypothetical protein